MVGRLVLAAALSAGVCQGQETVAHPDLEGQSIVRIVFERHNIFDTSDPETDSWPYRAANSLHVVTREAFLRSVLLFGEGDPYSTAVAAESERILRSLGFLNPVHIRPRPVEGGVEVVVETHDQWSLELDGDFGSTGSRSETALSVTEENFLGWGKEVAVEWESTTERNSYTLSYMDPAVLGSRWQTELVWSDTSDGYRNLVRVDRPFFSLATPLAGGGQWLDESLDEHLYAAGKSAVVGRRVEDAWRAWGGIRLPSRDRIARRLLLGYDYRNLSFEDWRWEDDGRPYPTPKDRRVGGPRLGYERETDNYRVIQGFRAWSIQEDVALGPNLAGGVTLSVPELGGDMQRLLVDGQAEIGYLHHGWLYLGTGWFEGRLDDGESRGWVGGVELVASSIGTRGWQFRLLVEDSHRLDLDRQLTLGAEIGLRGWDPDFFDGTGRTLLNLQYRRLIKRDLFQVLSVGATAFVDVGHTWDARVGEATGRPHVDAGIGLILDLGRIGFTNLLRIDAAVPDDGSGVTVSITSASLF